MAIKHIFQDDAPELKVICQEVGDMTPEIEQEIVDLVDTAVANPCQGLASSQIGGTHRIILVNLNHQKMGMTVMINPVWKKRGTNPKKVPNLEGCLSIEKTKANYEVKRFKSIECRYRDMDGNDQRLLLKKIDAYCVQHEVDHLDGKTIVDKGTFFKRAH